MEMLEIGSVLIGLLYLLAFALAVGELFVPGGILGTGALGLFVWSIAAAYTQWGIWGGTGLLAGSLVPGGRHVTQVEANLPAEAIGDQTHRRGAHPFTRRLVMTPR